MDSTTKYILILFSSLKAIESSTQRRIMALETFLNTLTHKDDLGN